MSIRSDSVDLSIFAYGRRFALSVPLLVIAACSPVPLAQAERDCLQDARLAERPRGTVDFGLGPGGRGHAALDVEISSDFLAGRDPQKVWQSCVYNRSGQIPTRPYSALRN